MSNVFSVPNSSCPWCGQEMNMTGTPFGSNAPNAGDLSICIRCAGILELDADWRLQKFEQDKLSQLALTDPDTYTQLMEVQAAIREVNQQSKENE